MATKNSTASQLGFHIPLKSSHLPFATSHTILLIIKMRSTALTTLFFALFALFSAIAYAAPVDPQGVVSKRQVCQMAGCKDAVNPPAPSSDSSGTSATKLIGEILASFYENYLSGADPAPAA